ncbi:unnamed protein product [Dovyalis caffra]|uniref:F-box domain-containing protein n=1 Tax=Dovyalis caffra TaxID=77055 RepID=A0AAV1QS80_9ROSI|nr:unnamed protein product [Dovyalis caffra]
MLLKKVWESLSNRRSSSIDLVITQPSYRESSSSSSSSSSLGAFDGLPIDVVLQIVKLVGPKDAARLSVVCQSWRSLVSDDRLWIYFLQQNHDPWHSVFFAETNLQKFSSLIAKSSFMSIYRQRVQVPGAVIVDCENSTYNFKFEVVKLKMQVKASAQPIVLSLPLCNYDDTESARVSRRQLKEAIYTALFDMDVPAVCAVNQATLALYAAQQTSGIVVNIGFRVTSVVPIFHGKVMRTLGVEVVDFGALKLTGFLKEQMRQNNINFQSLYTARTLKEKLCYVAADYEVELSKDTHASLEVPGEGLFTLSKERFTTGEVLFQPHIAGVHAMGLHEAVARCMDHCHAVELTGDDSWFKTVVLSGGTACLPGLVERLEKELHGLLPSSISKGIRVMSPAYGADTAWFGAKLISNLSTFPGSWCVTNKQFQRKSRLNLIWQELGAGWMARKCNNTWPPLRELMAGLGVVL